MLLVHQIILRLIYREDHHIWRFHYGRFDTAFIIILTGVFKGLQIVLEGYVSESVQTLMATVCSRNLSQLKRSGPKLQFEACIQALQTKVKLSDYRKNSWEWPDNSILSLLKIIIVIVWHLLGTKFYSKLYDSWLINIISWDPYFNSL